MADKLSLSVCGIWGKKKKGGGVSVCMHAHLCSSGASVDTSCFVHKGGQKVMNWGGELPNEQQCLSAGESLSKNRH